MNETIADAIPLPSYAFETPNLDCISTDPEDLDALSRVFDQLSAYAHDKAKAMRHRVDGNIQTAIGLERHADGIYKQLPEWARW